MRSFTSSSESPQGSVTPSAERLTAADRPGEAQPVPERPVPDRPFGVLLLVALALFAAMLGGWEGYWRAQGAVPGAHDDAALWAIQRRRIDAGEGDATVITAASRSLFDVELPVWERLSGRRPIQLAIAGTSPAFAVEDLAADPKFHGRLLIGIAPDVFFSGYEFMKGFGEFTHKESPSQRVGKWLSMHLVEPYFAFYDDDFALSTVLQRQTFWPDSFGRPRVLHVRKLSVMEPDRNNFMWSKVENDPDYRALCRRVWAQEFDPPSTDPKEIAETRKTRDAQIERMVKAIATLRARGVPVVFVREPSAGDYLAYENRDYPRAETWDPLLARTGAPGIYFSDYPQLTHYDLPEWSHMSKASAERYTADLYHILSTDFAAAGHW